MAGFRYLPAIERHAMIQISTSDEIGYPNLDAAYEAARLMALARVEEATAVLQRERRLLVDVATRKLKLVDE